MEEKELPVGWAEAPIHEINSYTSNATDPQAEPDQVFELYSVPAFPTRLPELIKGSEIGSTKQRVQNGDVLICKINPRINRVWSVGKNDVNPQIASSEWIVVRSPHLSASYLCRLFSSPGFRELLCDGVTGVGGSLTRAQPKRVREFKIPIAPASEQRHIASKLDTTLADVDACRQRLDGVAAILKRFRQAVLAAATSGELTREWREERGESLKPWKTVKTKEAGKIQLGRQRSPKYHSGPTMRPYLRVQNVFEDRIDLDDVMEMDFSGADLEKYTLHPCDILLNEGQSPQYLGRPAMYRGELPGACFTNSLIRFQAGTSVVPDFALLVFRHCMHSGRYVSEGTITTNIAHLSAGRFGEVEFPLPSHDEQTEIVRRAQQLFTLADQLDARLTVARKIVDRLTPALLAKAFRGELVPQDPSEEPASVLMERIRAARQSEAGAGKASGRGRKKAASNPESIALEAAPDPPDLLCALLQECGALSERALLAASGLEPGRFRRQLEIEIEACRISEALEEGERVLVESACER
jgi:type I restriction enzyme S subunit